MCIFKVILVANDCFFIDQFFFSVYTYNVIHIKEIKKLVMAAIICSDFTMGCGAWLAQWST